MHLYDVFDFIRVVNLPERRDRLAATARELRRLGMEFGSNGLEVFPAIRPDSPAGFPSIGARGCFLSHLEILRSALGKSAERVLVIEDDVEFTSSICDPTTCSIDAVRSSEWDILWLGHYQKVAGNGPQLIRFEGPLLTTHMYAVSGRVLPDLIRELESILQRPPGHPDGGPMHVDGAFNTFCRMNTNVVRKITVPSWANQRSSRSDVTRGPWFDRFSLTKGMAERVRALRRIGMSFLGK